MTEQEFMASADHQAMLQYLQVGVRGSVPATTSDRKLRLFGCAICRLYWDRISDPRSRRAVEVAERLADGLATNGEVRDARESAREAPCTIPPCLTCACAETLSGLAPRTEEDWFKRQLSFVVQAALLRDIVGNPFQPMLPATGGPDHHILDERVCERCGRRFSSHPGRCTGCGSEFIRKWRVRDEYPYLTSQVISLAHAAYDRRLLDGTLDPAALAVLADAIEEAGCTEERVCWSCQGYGTHLGSGPDRGNPTCDVCSGNKRTFHVHPIVEHLRSPGPHVRGCWAADVLTGRE